MGNVIFRGDATAVAQVSEVEIDGYDGSTTYGVTINGKTVSVTGTVDADTTIAALFAALNASTVPEFAEITWAEGSSSSHVQGTSDTAGKPYEAQAFTSGGGGTMDPTTTNTLTAVTASAGPNHWDTAANWDGAAVPVNGDAVYIEDSDVDILYGLDQIAVTLGSLTIDSGYTGEIGSAYYNTDDDGDTGTQYTEYRQRLLKIGTASITVGKGRGTGSGRLQIDLNAVNTAITIHNTGASSESELAALTLTGAGASSTLDMFGGAVDFAIRATETATLATIRQNAGTIRCGTGTTLAAITKGAGGLDIRSNVTTLTQSSGATAIRDTATVGTLALQDGSVNYLSNGTITTLTMGSTNKANPQPVLNFGGDARAVTVTNATVIHGRIADPAERVTWTNKIEPGAEIAAP